jgi:hypothetical protein
VEYVKDGAKIVYLLECLQKTAPPVCIFCEKKQDVDDIHEYLLLKVCTAYTAYTAQLVQSYTTDSYTMHMSSYSMRCIHASGASLLTWQISVLIVRSQIMWAVYATSDVLYAGLVVDTYTVLYYCCCHCYCCCCYNRESMQCLFTVAKSSLIVMKLYSCSKMAKRMYSLLLILLLRCV